MDNENICVCGIGLMQPSGELIFLDKFGEYYKHNKGIVGTTTRDVLNWFENSDVGILFDCKGSQSFINIKNMGVSQEDLIKDVEKILKKSTDETLRHIRGRINAEIEGYQGRNLFLKGDGFVEK